MPDQNITLRQPGFNERIFPARRLLQLSSCYPDNLGDVSRPGTNPFAKLIHKIIHCGQRSLNDRPENVVPVQPVQGRIRLRWRSPERYALFSELRTLLAALRSTRRSFAPSTRK